MGFCAGLRPILHQRMPKHSSSYWVLIDLFLDVCLGECVCICFLYIQLYSSILTAKIKKKKKKKNKKSYLYLVYDYIIIIIIMLNHRPTHIRTDSVHSDFGAL